MVVGNDCVNAERGRLIHFGDIGSAAVHGYQQGNPFAAQRLDGTGVQAVSLVNAVGDVGDDVGVEVGERGCEQRGAGDAVGVEVAEYADALVGV